LVSKKNWSAGEFARKNVMETPALTAFVTSVRDVMIFRYTAVFFMDFLS
jgi:hypothetical protein